jgi:hypothetical protein
MTNNLVLSRNILSMLRKRSSQWVWLQSSILIMRTTNTNYQSWVQDRRCRSCWSVCLITSTHLTTNWFPIPNLSVTFSGPIQILLSCLTFFPLCSSWNPPTSLTNTNYRCLSLLMSLLLMWHTSLQLLLWCHKMKTTSFELYNKVMA